MGMTFLDKEKEPFDATRAGVVVNTILGLPKAAVDVAKDIGRGVARSIGSTGLTIGSKFGGDEEMSAENIKSLFGQELWKNAFGDEPLKSIETRIVEAENKIKTNEYAQKLGVDKFATPLAFGGIMGMTALDLTPFGGLEKNAAKKILAETSVEGALKIAKELGADEQIAKQLAPIFASTKTEKEAKQALELAKNLIGTKSLATKEVGQIDNTLFQEFVNKQPSFFRGEGGSDVAQGKALLANGRHFAMDTEYPKRFGNVSEYKLNPNAKIFDAGDTTFGEMAEKLGLGKKIYISPNELTKTLKERGYDILRYTGEYKSSGKPFTHIVEINDGNLIPKSQLTDIRNQANKPKRTPINYAEYDEGYFGRKPIELPEELMQREDMIRFEEEILEQDPAKELTKYMARSGEFKGQLPEVLGMRPEEVKKLRSYKTIKSPKTLEYIRRGDSIITELGFKDSEEANIAFQKYVDRKESLKLAENQLKQDIKEYKLQLETKGQETPKSPVVKVLESEMIAPDTVEARSLQKTAEEQLGQANLEGDLGGFSLPRSIEVSQTPVKAKVHLLDYIRTPDRVLKKIGLEKEADFLRDQYEGYLKELPKNIDKITTWSKELPKESNQRLFKWLDGQAVDLNSQEQKVGNEIKDWLKEWANRLDLPEDNRIATYITHIFDDQLVKKEFDEDLAKIIADKIPQSVYDPFLQKRLGAKGFIEDTWKALDAYVKRATRKVYMDPALEKIYDKAAGFEKSQWDYVKSYTDRLNLRPTEIDTLLDNGVKNLVGYRFGQRPVNAISRLLRQMTYRAFLGLNVSSALKNISQGINTYAKLGEKYTVLGYAKLFSSKAREELISEGVLNTGFIQDKTLSATKKTLEKVDSALFYFFDKSEKINRGAAFFGGKAKALAEGKSEVEAIKEAKKLVRDTQFSFGSIDTPIFLQSDIGKTLGQFQSFTTKQIEFLSEMVKNKEYAGLLRYAVSGMAFIYTIGKVFGMEPKELLPVFRIGTPPSLQLPTETIKAVVGTPDKYGQPRSVGEKISDVGKSALSLIPASTQIKKTIQGISAVKQGESQTKTGRTQFKVGGTLPKDIQAILFGKYASPEAKAYFNPKKKTKTTMTF